MVPHHREVRESEGTPDLGRAEQVPERLLDSLLDLGDLATDGREPTAGGVEDLGAAVEAAVDRRDQPRELADALPQPAQAGELVADPVEPAVELADGAEGLAGLGQVLCLEHAADLGAPHQLTDVVQTAERGPQAGANGLDHLGGERLALVDLGGVGARLEAMGPRLAQGARRPRGDEGAELVELEEFQRMAVHIGS